MTRTANGIDTGSPNTGIVRRVTGSSKTRLNIPCKCKVRITNIKGWEQCEQCGKIYNMQLVMDFSEGEQCGKQPVDKYSLQVTHRKDSVLLTRKPLTYAQDPNIQNGQR